ncbi:DUF4251 domain-containing protein [Winogradskyella sp.]|uniref:DUF4251 domain-containing protein n=1 Tax=Winogradskyella sp. TaxID=1883156 RepID=UPI003BA9ED5A
MKKLILLTLLIYIALPSQSFGQEQIKKDRAEAIYLGHKALVETQNFKFVADWVFNDGKRKEVPGDLNTIRINTSEVKGLLATFDSANKIYGFKDKLEDYSTQFNDGEQQITIQFKTGMYHITITIKPNGNAFLDLSANNSKLATYRGVITK